ncbi:beta-lactamase/transpeptidase-like protein [Durotheca rogersii]|uniref:beta-lactamase/transpeptidase-like protein n=1 Tax=Durotheca rogersii TaxID=419775 RepID=UPI00221F6577|nr:beta-lactamase/transpeptidase-like protein [Durotheca rogersii]KAI5862040.1 beta-lactamase/transpeptidase-like protein [Durotheca rogersii]
MASLDDLLESAVNDGTAPGVVIIAKDKEGKVDYAKAFSREGGTPYALDTAMVISSMTKLPTSIAALQLVDRGLVALDEDLSPLLPAFAEKGVLISVADDGTPAVRKRRNPITLRHLITHASGAGYPFLDKARLGKIRSAHEHDTLDGTVEETFDLPMLFEPGEGWAYGTGLDWAGVLVEWLSGLSLDEYMKRNLWEPLGVGGDSSPTFFPDKKPAARVPVAFCSDPDGPAVEKPGAPTIVSGLKACYGGHGLAASMRACFEAAYSLLVDDGRLLSRETAALMFQPQLSPASRQSLAAFMEKPKMKLLFPSPLIDRDYGLGGLLIAGDGHEYWRKGTLMCGGAANLNWVGQVHRAV